MAAAGPSHCGWTPHRMPFDTAICNSEYTGGITMPAKRGKNFRSGDLAEQLAMYLLQSVALVAPIPRTEDVGIDAVCTLLSEYNQYSYLAEESFYVQIKSNSVTEIEYSGVEVQWLTELKLPLFVATVDKNNTKIMVYSCKRLYDAIALKKDRNYLKLILSDNQSVDKFDLISEDQTDIYLGEPIVVWSISDLMNEEKNTRLLFLNLMKEHIKIIHKDMELYTIGLVSSYIWKTNELPEEIGYKACGTINISIDELHGKMMSYLIKSLDIALKNHDFDMINEVESLIKEYKSIDEHFNYK